MSEESELHPLATKYGHRLVTRIARAYAMDIEVSESRWTITVLSPANAKNGKRHRTRKQTPQAKHAERYVKHYADEFRVPKDNFTVTEA